MASWHPGVLATTRALYSYGVTSCMPVIRLCMRTSEFALVVWCPPPLPSQYHLLMITLALPNARFSGNHGEAGVLIK